MEPHRANRGVKADLLAPQLAREFLPVLRGINNHQFANADELVEVLHQMANVNAINRAPLGHEALGDFLAISGLRRQKPQVARSNKRSMGA